MEKGYKRRARHWLLELLRGPSKADLDYQKMLGAALALAQSDLSDQEALERLRDIAMSSEFGVQGIVQYMERRRDNYVGDRMYRLAEAVMTGQAVEPQDYAFREQFRREEELGRLPLEIAFEQLVGIIPDLSDWRVAVENEGLHVPQMRRLEKIVGPNANQSNALARSDIARAVATTYLGIIAGDTRRGGADIPYFVIRGRSMVSVAIDRRK